MQRDGLPYALGRAIRHRRQAMGLTQAECAKLLGVAPQTIRNMEKGHVRSSRSFGAICKVLKIKPEQMLRQADAALGGAPMFPATGRLARELMDRRGMTTEDLMAAMGCDRDEVERLLAGDAGPLLWGAAAVALGVSVWVFERAVVDGYEPAMAVVELSSQSDLTHG